MAEIRVRRCKRSPAWNREERRQHVEDQAASGLSIQDYCFAHGLNIRAFHGWRRGVQAEPLDSDKGAVEESRPSSLGVFAEIEVDSPEPSRQVFAMELVLRCGHRLRVGADFDEETLRRLVMLLESLPC